MQIRTACGCATPAYLGRLVSRTPENASHVFPTFGVLAGKSLAKSAFTLPRFRESLRGVAERRPYRLCRNRTSLIEIIA